MGRDENVTLNAEHAAASRSVARGGTHVQQPPDPCAVLADDLPRPPRDLGDVRTCEQPDAVSVEAYEPADQQAVSVCEVRKATDVLEQVEAEELSMAERRERRRARPPACGRPRALVAREVRRVRP